VEVATSALREHEIEPVYITTGGGSDANVFIAGGLTVVNLANGTERNHQPDESVTLESLETMLEVTVSLIRQAALVAAQTTLDD
jgi:tripeptide aminopeptidase